MFDSTTFTKDMLSNPTMLMSAVIGAMEKSDATGAVMISDPNNGFTMQLAATLAVQSQLSEKIDNTLSTIFPQRARNAEQLYPHLSEFDYVKLQASPATLPFSFAMDADWIRRNAVYYDTNYNRLVIPANSFLTMSGITYSMYHSIEILVNRNTNAIAAFYDGSEKNTLKELKSNMLIDTQSYQQNGLNYFSITFNMFQFQRKEQIFTVGSEEGFVKTLTYDDQFYAMKVSTQNSDGTWSELAYSLPQLYYDYQTPTAILTLRNDASNVQIKIPQIYFDNRQISKNIKVELYTTKGKVNYSLSLADVNDISANFDTNSSKYAAPLDQMPTSRIFPTVIEVVGGSDALTYEEVREAVVNQRLSDRVAVTTPEIIQAGKRAGFELSLLKDDLTERIYFASNVLTDSNDMIIPTFTGNILIADNSLKGNPSTIISHTDGYYTILPTTTFKVSQNSNTCVPMTDGDVAAMGAMTKTQMVDELNSGSYVRQPFHITLRTDAKSPKTSIYNLLSPEMTQLVFDAENAHSAPQMSMTTSLITHLANGTGGYQVRLGMTRSSNIEDISASNLVVIVSCVNKSGDYVYLPATYAGTTAEGLDMWDVLFETNYHLTADDYLTVVMYNSSDVKSTTEISLNQKFSVVASFYRRFDPNVPQDASLNSYLPASISATLTAMARQTMTISFGRNLSSQIYCGVDTTWGNDVYKVAENNIYHHTQVPIFQTDPVTKIINTRVDPTTKKVETVKIYDLGDIPANTEDLVIRVTSDTLPVSIGTTTTLKLASVEGLLVGMKVRGTNIPVSSTVLSITADGVVIDQKITAVVAGGNKLVFTNPHPDLLVTNTQTIAGKELKVASTADLLVGLSIFGFDIPQDAVIESIVDATTFTINKPTTVPVKKDTLLTIINLTAPGVVKIASGQLVRDEAGKPIVIKSAQNQYLIPAILFDGRLFASEDPIDNQIINTIAQRLNSYANQISTLDAGLIEGSDVYYKPARSMGLVNFNIGAGRTINMSLGLSFSVTIYVDAAVYNTQTLLSTMEATVIEIINDEVQKPIISVSEITKVISEKLGPNAAAVEMGPISGRDGLRLISINQSEITPSIEHLLLVEADGHIKRKPNVSVTYLPKPDTTEATTKATL